MLPLLPLDQTLHFFILLLALGVASSLLLARHLFQALGPRVALCLAYAIPPLGFALWAPGNPPWAAIGVRLAWTWLVVLAPATAALFVTALVFRGLNAIRAGSHARSPSVPSASRRAVLQASLSLLPAAAASAGLEGLRAADDDPRVPIVKMRFRDLPPDLIGLRILHLSDLHLGVSKRTAHLEALLERVAELAPDLIVVTGDLADDLGELERALAVLARKSPRLGVLTCLGNHEYLHDIHRTRSIYERSAVPLLVDRGVTLVVGRAKLHVAGADDPFELSGEALTRFLERSVARGGEGAPEGAFRLLLSHRPEGFIPAARQGVHLTLAGHTHGGQLGLLGRSVFEALAPEAFLWGAYARGRSRLYTSSGFGHWFPFRLGCPTEAPLIVLERE